MRGHGAAVVGGWVDATEGGGRGGAWAEQAGVAVRVVYIIKSNHGTIVVVYKQTNKIVSELQRGLT